VTLQNVQVLGKIVVSGAGESHHGDSSIVLRNVEAAEMLIDNAGDQFVSIRAEGDTEIGLTNVRTPSYLEDATPAGRGLRVIEMDGDEGDNLQLAGNIKQVINRAPGTTLTIARGAAEQVTVDE